MLTINYSSSFDSAAHRDSSQGGDAHRVLFLAPLGNFELLLTGSKKLTGLLRKCFCGLFPKWMLKMNPVDFGNVPSGISG